MKRFKRVVAFLYVCRIVNSSPLHERKRNVNDFLHRHVMSVHVACVGHGIGWLSAYFQRWIVWLVLHLCVLC